MFCSIALHYIASQSLEASAEADDLVLESIAAVYNVLERKKQKKERQLSYISRDQRQMMEMKALKRRLCEDIWKYVKS
jgi:hypothetical protein